MVQCDTSGRASRHFGPAFPGSAGFSQTGCVNAPLSLAGSLSEPRFRTRGPWCDLDRREASRH